MYVNIKKDKAILSGMLTAFLFGIHPLHVESVAWISERKNVLYVFFFLLSLIEYLKYTARSNKYNYYLAFLFFVLSSMSKPMAVSLPVVLIILDYYPTNRLSNKNAKTLIIEKLPFFVVSVLVSVIAIYAAREGGALRTFEFYPLDERILVAVHAFVLYLIKMVLPINLSPYYPFPSNIYFLHSEYTMSCFLFIGGTILCLMSYIKNKIFSAVWFYYVVTLIPVIGIVKVGGHAMADRYAYLPSIGPFLLMSLGVCSAIERFQRSLRLAIVIILILVSGMFIVMTQKQISIRHDSITLFSRVIELYPDIVDHAYYKRGNIYEKMNNYKQALDDYSRALEINPQFIAAYNDRGIIYNKMGSYELAIKDFTNAIEINPQHPKAYYNRGNTFYYTGRYEEAIKDYSTTIGLAPKFAETYYNLGMIYSKLGNEAKAREEFETVLRLKPDNLQARQAIESLNKPHPSHL